MSEREHEAIRGDDSVIEYTNVANQRRIWTVSLVIFLGVVVIGAVLLLFYVFWNRNNDNQFQEYQGAVNDILSYSLENEGPLQTFLDLAYMCNTFGPRLSGSSGIFRYYYFFFATASLNTFVSSFLKVSIMQLIGRSKEWKKKDFRTSILKKPLFLIGFTILWGTLL
jgi:hypothetical protein